LLCNEAVVPPTEILVANDVRKSATIFPNLLLILFYLL